MKSVGIIVILFLLVGCGASQMLPTETTFLPDGSTVVSQDPLAMAEDKRNAAILKCEEARKAEAEAERAKAEQMSKPPVCPPDMSEISCMAIQFNHSQSQTMNTVLTFAGKVIQKPEPTCGEAVGKGLFDFKTVEVQEKNKSFRHGSDSFAGGLKNFMLGLVGLKAFDKAGDTTDVDVTGNENAPVLTGRTTSEQTGTAFGEDSPVNQGESGAPATPVVPGITPVETVDTAD